MEHIKLANPNYDEWLCLCGNTAQEEGFYSCNSQGQEVDPTPEEWDNEWYLCAKCGRIIRQSDRAVVAVKLAEAVYYDKTLVQKV